MAKISPSAQLFCLIAGLVALALVGLGGYVYWVNKQVGDVAAAPAVSLRPEELSNLARPAHVRLTGVITGEPILIPLTPRKPGEPPPDPKTTLPPRMNVWVPLYLHEADRASGNIQAVYLIRGEPLANRYTPPREYEGLIAEGAFGMLRPTPPKGIPAAALVLEKPHENLAITYQIPGIGAALAALCAVCFLVSIPWANWDMPGAKKPRETVIARPRRVRLITTGSSPLSVHIQSKGRFVRSILYFVIPGLLLLAIGGGGLTQYAIAEKMGEAGFLLILLVLGGMGLVVYGAIRTNKMAERVERHDEGLQWYDGKEKRSALWEDVIAIYRTDEVSRYQSFYSTRKADTLVVFGDDTKVQFDDSVNDYDELSDAIFERTMAHLTEMKRREYRAGGAEFGLIKMSQGGLSFEGGSVEPWKRYIGYKIENGWFYLGTREYGLFNKTYETKNIPNIHVLVYLLDEHFAEAQVGR